MDACPYTNTSILGQIGKTWNIIMQVSPYPKQLHPSVHSWDIAESLIGITFGMSSHV